MDNEDDSYVPLSGYVTLSFDERTKVLVLPFNKFGDCISYEVGFMTIKLIGDGSMRSVYKTVENEFRLKIEGEKDISNLLKHLTDKKIHTTVLNMRNGDINTVSVFKCINCESKREFIIKKNAKRKLEMNDFFLMIYSRLQKSDLTYICRIKNVHVVCSMCKVVYTTFGHVCENVCKLLPSRSFDSVFQRTVCLDVFYDIETYTEEGGERFVPGLVAFLLKIRIVNEDSGIEYDEVANETDTYLNIIRHSLDAMLTHYHVEYRIVKCGDDSQKCYFIRDDILNEHDDIMLSFLIFLETMTQYMFTFGMLKCDSRISLISFNGNKFDDFFFFKALTKKGSFCNLGLEKCSILERGSKLLCLSFQLIRRDKKRVYFRTHDLRNFLSTGSLQSNAEKFKIPVGKTLFPHSLINAVKSGKENKILDSFPDYIYYEEIIKPIEGCTHPVRNCEICKKLNYEKEKSEFMTGSVDTKFDVFEVWTQYCCNDVLVLKVLYYLFFNELEKQFAPLFGNKSFDGSAKLTLPSLTNTLGYKRACQNYKDLLYSPISDSLAKTFTCIYGGHCQTTIIGKIPDPQEYVFFDFNGEYSGLMTAPFPCGRIKKISQQRTKELNDLVKRIWRFRENCHFKDLPGFIVECTMKAPSDPRFHFDLPNVPERDAAGVLVWSNRSKKGIYSSVDIFVARHYYNYEIEIIFSHTNIEFSDWAPLLKDYVEYCQKMKIEGKIEKNPCKENVGKLMGNALYGYQIKKPDVEKVEFIKNVESFTTLKMQEQINLLKIKSICPVNKIIESRTQPKHIIQLSGVPAWNDGENLPLYHDDMIDPFEVMEPMANDYPLYVKYEKSNAWVLQSNTMVHVGIFVLSYSRVINAQLYFSMFITPKELEIPIEEREPIVIYTDTDSFLVKNWRINKEGGWSGNKNVAYNHDTGLFEPWGKNELTFVPKVIYIAGKKLYLCKGDSDDPKQMKTASKGVDKNQITIENFEKLIRKERIQFEQKSFKKNFDTYDIECTCIRRQIGLGNISMKPYKFHTDYVIYRPLNDSDQIVSYPAGEDISLFDQ